jgi:hypothetical protein
MVQSSSVAVWGWLSDGLGWLEDGLRMVRGWVGDGLGLAW